MVENYEVNASTLAVIAISENLSRVIEKENDFLISKSTLEIIEESCLYFGSTFSGRCEGTKKLLGYSYKLPIIIEESKSLIFFPTASPRFNTCSWLSLHNVDKFVPNENGARVLFKNGTFFDLKQSYDSLENQLMRATRLDCVLQYRKNG